jgi:hypothetical protein
LGVLWGTIACEHAAASSVGRAAVVMVRVVIVSRRRSSERPSSFATLCIAASFDTLKAQQRTLSSIT